MSSDFLSWLVSVYKISYKCLLLTVWLKHSIVYLLIFWVLMVLLRSLGLLGLYHLLFCLALLVSPLYISLLLSYGLTLLVYQLLPLYYSIKISLLSILLSNLYSTHIFLYQNNPKSLLLIHLVIKFLNLWE